MTQKISPVVLASACRMAPAMACRSTSLISIYQLPEDPPPPDELLEEPERLDDEDQPDEDEEEPELDPPMLSDPNRSNTCHNPFRFLRFGIHPMDTPASVNAWRTTIARMRKKPEKE